MRADSKAIVCGNPGIADEPPSLRRRAGAAGLDYLVILIWIAVVTALGFAARAFAPSVSESLRANPGTGELSGFVLLTLPVALYFIFSEASPSGATWGKNRTELQVVALDGARIGLLRSTVRTTAKLLPWELSHFAIWQLSGGSNLPALVPYVALGFAWTLVGLTAVSAILSRRRRMLHDFAAGTVVVHSARSGRWS